MNDSDLIDVESLDYSDDQTWLCKIPDDSGERVDIVDWSLSLDWPVYDDSEYLKTEKELYSMLDEVLHNNVLAMPDKHKFDSRTYVKPKKRTQRPSIQSIVETSPPSLSPNSSLNHSANKYLTYNKYSAPLGPILRLKTFNVDTNTENSSAVKEFAMKRRSLVPDDDPQLEDADMTMVTGTSERLSSDPVPSKPINIDLSQPAHNLHNTFNKGLTNMMNERCSLNMYQSGDSLMRMSPPSLVSSLLMDSSGTFNPESLDSRKSILSHRDSGLPTSGRASIDPMMTSMTLSILDEKDMSTSFLSQTTYHDNESFMDSLPPSLVSSVNSSFVISNATKPRTDSMDSNNIFSSATFTHLEQTEKLLSARPRIQNMYNNFTKRESSLKNSESYTKAREEACQIDTTKILNANSEKKDSPKNTKPTNEMGEAITLHYSNAKFGRDEAEKENVLNVSFEKNDAFYKDMGMQRTVDLERNSLNVTLDKQELNEIQQARLKLSLARKALPIEIERPLPNQVDTTVKTYQLQNPTVTVPRKNMENASELLARRRMLANGYDKHEEQSREPPKRNATFKKPSPPKTSMDATVVLVKDDNQIIDINSATLDLIDCNEKTLQSEDWGSQDRAMVGSSESTDTGTFSSSSPPDSVPENIHNVQRNFSQAVSTPICLLRKGSDSDLVDTTISPIYDLIDNKSIMPANNPPDVNITINTATIVKKTAVKRDILAGKVPVEKKVLGPSEQQKSLPSKVPRGSYNPIANPAAAVLRRTNLPTSKLRQYSSHKDLRIPVGSGSATSVPGLGRASTTRTMLRRNVYASNPALSPTAPSPPVRRDSYTIDVGEDKAANGPTALASAPPPLVRQGTETLRRERPQSHLVQPKDLRGAGQPAAVGGAPVFMRNHQRPPPTTRPYSIAGASQLRVTRPVTVPMQKQAPATAHAPEPARPASGSEARVSALPRPTRLPAPAPRRGLRPPSVYSVAPTADVDHY